MSKLSRREFIQLVGILSCGEDGISDAPMTPQAPLETEYYEGTDRLLVHNGGLYQIAFMCHYRAIYPDLCRLSLQINDEEVSAFVRYHTENDSAIYTAAIYGLPHLDANSVIVSRFKCDNGKIITQIDPRLMAVRIQ